MLLGLKFGFWSFLWFLFFLRIRRQSQSTLTYTLFPYTTLFRSVRERLVHRNRPRRGRPDHRMRADQLTSIRRLDDLERHVDLRRDDVLIFNLGLGERGLFDRRPHHRLGTAIELADRKSTRLTSSHSCASRMPAPACKKKNHNT